MIVLCIFLCFARDALSRRTDEPVSRVFSLGAGFFGMRLRMVVLHKGVTMGWKSARGLMIVHLALNVVLVCTTFSAYFYVLE